MHQSIHVYVYLSMPYTSKLLYWKRGVLLNRVMRFFVKKRLYLIGLQMGKNELN